MVEICHGYSPTLFKKMNKELKLCGISGTIIWDKQDRMFYLFCSRQQLRFSIVILL